MITTTYLNIKLQLFMTRRGEPIVHFRHSNTRIEYIVPARHSQDQTYRLPCKTHRTM